jgi:dihydrofolate reductase
MLQRPRCSVFIALSVDGFIAHADGTFDFLSIVEEPGQDYGFADFFGTVDVLVIGRNTYETALGFPEWPYAGKRCIVITHREAPSQHGEQFFAGEPAALVEQLALAGAQRLYVDGGAVIRQFLAANLIDDMTLSVIPTLLGQGISLFGAEVPEQRLVLEGSQAYPSGLVQLRYARAQAERSPS